MVLAGDVNIYMDADDDIYLNRLNTFNINQHAGFPTLETH